MITKIGTVEVTEKETKIIGFEFSYPYLAEMLPINSGLAEVAALLRARADKMEKEALVSDPSLRNVR